MVLHLNIYQFGRRPESSGFLSALLARFCVPSAARHCLGLPEGRRREEELNERFLSALLARFASEGDGERRSQMVLSALLARFASVALIG